jgi:hypothetical protein
MTSAVIRLDHLRRRRMDTGFNVLTELRTEIYREMFDQPIYPANSLVQPLMEVSELHTRRDPYALGVMKKLVERGVLTPPMASRS